MQKLMTSLGASRLQGFRASEYIPKEGPTKWEAALETG